MASETLPHEKSGNSTIYARLIISEDRISPIDAKRVLLVDRCFKYDVAI